jgi:ribose transport system ATP-binding protein
MQQSTRTSAALDLSGITKTYPGVRALSNVSVSIRPGVVHAILGENGAGKSTLVGIAAGSVVPDEGTIDLLGETRSRMDPRSAREAGLAIVYQVPALAPSLSVLDAMLLLVPESRRPSRREALAWTAALFERLGLAIDPRVLVSALTQREAHLVEVAAALASEPAVLVLDEPTEALGPEETLWLFARIEELLLRDVAIVYITHRIPEVVAIATDLTVLRDGKVVGRGVVADFTEDQIVELIVGRSLETTFPDKVEDASEVVFEIVDASGDGFANVSLTVRRGEIVGLAGVEGNGQRQFLRSLGGHGRFSGTARLSGTEVAIRSPRSVNRSGIVFLPGDRLGEALFGRMSVRENVVAPSLRLAMPSGFTSSATEDRLARRAVAGLAIKTPNLDVSVAALSGGSQQKVLLARSRLGESKVILVEDPTQGVDAGARVEIYAFLRRLASSGVAVVVLSTDAVELEGLCDSVSVFSRGRVRATLGGDQLTEKAITGTAVLASDDAAAARLAVPSKPHRRRRIMVGGEFQMLALLGLSVVLSVATTLVASSFVSPLNLGELLASASTLILVGLAQLVVVITGGIDLSVGSVVALAGVVVSYFGSGGPGNFVLGVVLAIVAGAFVGVVNGLLVTRLTIPPVIATLVTSIAVLGVAQLLRPQPGGEASSDLMTALGTEVGVIPLVLVIAIAIAVVLWFVIGRTSLGRGLRAAGSDPVKANRMGVRVGPMRMNAAIAAGVLASIAGLALFTQTGLGDANSAQALTLTSVTAVVIAGASIFGGSGSALAVAAGALLLEVITSALNFLSLGLAWQYWFQGGFVLIAAVIPMIARYRNRSRSTVASS